MASISTRVRTLVALLGRGRRHGEGHVHFHQGPQGRPAPCFDEGCPNPRLAP